MRIIILLVALMLSGCATTGPAPQVQEEADPRMVELDRLLKEGKITNVEHARGKLERVRQKYPTHAELHALRAYGVVLGAQLDRGEITPEMADYLWAEKVVEFYKGEDERAARQRQYYPQPQGGGGINAADLLMLDMIRRPFNAPSSCHTRDVAGVQYTDCY